MSASTHDEAPGMAQILSGGTATLIALALLVFGEPTAPGERRKALFAVLEDMMGYYPMCIAFCALGVAMLGYGLVVRYRASRA